MKKLLISTLTLFIIFTSYSQKKYQGLLWEISGNGLDKPSYLYGTMHVSKKVAFHLSDTFFLGINNADVIALESDPSKWIDGMIDLDYVKEGLNYFLENYEGYKGFYQLDFETKKPEKDDFKDILSRNHSMINGLLYRNSSYNQEFEEDTYLDMFIFQCGSKKNKQIESLEGFAESQRLVDKAQMPNQKKPKVAQWLRKLFREKGYNLLEEFYRDQDLDMLDSIQHGYGNENSYRYMLTERNIIMADNYDKIVKTGKSLFAGIGAAHLAGETGVIELLREKGYKVRAVGRSQTKYALEQKEYYENLIRNKEYLSRSTADGFLTANMPEKLYEISYYDDKKTYISPDMTNGSFIFITRISTYDYIHNFGKNNNLKRIDSLLFENIPGKILEKKEVLTNGYPSLDILNKTKTGNYQRYRIISTPLELIVVKMSGYKEYVKNNGDRLFGTLQVNPNNSTWVNHTSARGEFNVSMPGMYKYENKDPLTSRFYHPFIQSFDISDSSYYYFKRTSLNDVYHVEEDDFELERITNKYFDNYEMVMISSEKFSFENHPAIKVEGYTDSTESRKVEMQVIIKGQFYYMLMAINSSDSKADKFFNSFKTNSFNYKDEFKKMVDTNLFFSATTTAYPSKKKYRRYDLYDENDMLKDNSYQDNETSVQYWSEFQEKVSVRYEKYHDYNKEDHVDSLWNNITDYYKRINYKILNKKISTSPYKQMDILYSDSNSTRAIRDRFLIKHGAMWAISAVIDTITGPTKYVSEFFNSFKPLDTLIGKDMFSSKIEAYFNAINNGDSLSKERAYESTSRLDFEDDEVPQLINFIKTHEFPTDKLDQKLDLLNELSWLEHSNIIPFLTELYEESEDKPIYQEYALKILSRKDTKEATEAYISLLEKDIPLVSGGYTYSSIFSGFYDSLDLAKKLYPSLLDYASIPEYSDDIYGLLATLVDSNEIKTKHYKKYKNLILNQAKIEYKRQLSQEQEDKADAENESSYTKFPYEGNDNLNSYLSILSPYTKDKKISYLINKIDKNIEDKHVRAHLITLQAKYNMPYQQSDINKLAKDLKTRMEIYEGLKSIKKENLFPKEYKTQQYFAEALLYDYSYQPKKDTIEFIEKREFEEDGKKVVIYFFKSFDDKEEIEDDSDWDLDFIAFELEKENELATESLYKRSGTKIDEKKEELSELIDRQTEKIKLRKRPRVMFRKLGDKSNNGYYGSLY